MPPLCKGRCPSAHTGAEGLGGRQFNYLKTNANSYNDIVPFRIGLCHHFGAYCPIPPTPLYTRGACAQKPAPGSIQHTAKLQFVCLLSRNEKNNLKAAAARVRVTQRLFMCKENHRHEAGGFDCITYSGLAKAMGVAPEAASTLFRLMGATSKWTVSYFTV